MKASLISILRTKNIYCLTVLLLLISHNVFGENVLSAKNTEAFANSRITLQLGIDNSDSFNALQLDLHFPSELAWVTDSVRLTDRASDHSLSFALISPGRLRIIAWSAVNTSFTGSTGSVIEIDFITGVNSGTYTLNLTDATLSGDGGNNILSGTLNGTFVLKAPRLSLSSESLDWDRVPLLQEAFRSVSITNTGNLPLQISLLTFSDARFSLTQSTPFTIEPGQSLALSIRFYSMTKGSISGTLSILSNDPSGDRLCILSVVAFAVNEIHLGSAVGRSGYEIEVPVSINNMEEFCAFQFSIFLPSAFKFVKGSEQLNVNRTGDHALLADTTGNLLNVIAYSPTNFNFSGNDDTIFTFRLYLEGAGGNYTLFLANPIVANVFSENIISDSYGSVIRISAPNISINPASLDFGNVSTLESKSMALTITNSGDDILEVKGISIFDAAYTITESVPFSLLPGNSKILQVRFEATDGLYHDSKLRIRSNDVVKDPMDVILSSRSYYPNEIRIIDCEAIEGEADTIFIELFNQSLVGGFQFDIEFPSSLLIDPGEVFLTNRKADHSILAAVIAQGKLRIISYSASLKSYNGATGAILGIPVQAPSGMTGVYPLVVSEVIISDINSMSVGTGSRSGSITVNLSTNYDDEWTRSIRVYPNPANDHFLVELPDQSINNLILTTLYGVPKYIRKNLSGTCLISTEGQKPGLYILVVESNGKKYSKSIIIY